MATSTERAFIATPIPTAGARVIASPFQFWTSGEDNLRIRSVCSVAGVTIGLQGRFISPDGTISAASWTHTPNGDRTLRSDEFALGVGAALNLVAFVRSGSPQIGQCFVILDLIRGRGTAATLLGTVLQGYVTAGQVLAWPGSPLQQSTDGQGALLAITGTQPALGGAVAETVPTGARWELASLHVGVTNAFGFGAATPLLTVKSGVNTLVGIAGQQNLIAGSGSADFWWLAGFSSPKTANDLSITTSFPVGFTLLAGQVIGVTSMGANYQYSAPHYVVREWLEVN